jgi:hypothetical protein
MIRKNTVFSLFLLSSLFFWVQKTDLPFLSPSPSVDTPKIYLAGSGRINFKLWLAMGPDAQWN